MKRFLTIIVASLVLTFAPVGAGSIFGVSSVRADTTKTVSLSDAQRLFKAMAGQKDIAFRYVLDGCYARAHLMIQRMEKMGVKADRVWSFPTTGSKLMVNVGRTSLTPKGTLTWTYHVAPVLTVNLNGKLTYMVVDPSMFPGPVTIQQWASKQICLATKRPAITRVTRVGEAPVLANGLRALGSGYWPGVDPREGPTAHATMMMRRFKALEPR